MCDLFFFRWFQLDKDIPLCRGVFKQIGKIAVGSFPRYFPGKVAVVVLFCFCCSVVFFVVAVVAVVVVDAVAVAVAVVGGGGVAGVFIEVSASSFGPYLL